MQKCFGKVGWPIPFGDTDAEMVNLNSAVPEQIGKSRAITKGAQPWEVDSTRAFHHILLNRANRNVPKRLERYRIQWHGQ